MVDSQTGVQKPTGSSLMLAAVIGIAFLFLIIGRFIGLVDVSGNDNVDGAQIARLWLMEIGLWVASIGLAAGGLATKTFPPGASAAMVLVAVFLMVTADFGASFAGFFSGF